MVRRYCKEGKIPTAVLTDQGWQIPEGTPKPGTDMIREPPQTKLVKKFLYQRERNQHFDNYNGRVGRILMMKECLRYGIDPFIIDDKRRGAYNRGIKQWDTNPEILTAAVLEAQTRFQSKMGVCRLMEYHRPPKD